jgi:hypothetical protein
MAQVSYASAALWSPLGATIVWGDRWPMTPLEGATRSYNQLTMTGDLPGCCLNVFSPSFNFHEICWEVLIPK